MKAFVIYTVLRLALFAATYAVFAGLWWLVFGGSGALLIPFLVALIVSSVLALKFLAPQRNQFALVVQARAERASAAFEERKAREDTD